MDTIFNPADYWESRHLKYEGDHRNVGDAGLSSEQNMQLISTKASIVSYVLAELGVTRNALVLDAGCGAGAFTKLLKYTGFNMTGSDISKTSVERTREDLDIRVIHAPLHELEDIEAFDVVLCLDVLFHVVDDDLWRASIDALFAAVKPGGHFMIIEYFPPEGKKPASHCRWRSLDLYNAPFAEKNIKPKIQFQFVYPHRETQQKTLLVYEKPLKKSRKLNLRKRFK